MWTCGSNEYGQLGLGHTKNRKFLTKVGDKDNANKFVQVSCGSDHTIALDQDGYLWVCGINIHGQLGLGHVENKFNLVKISNCQFASVSCGYNHTVALDTEGVLWSWGYNKFGQLGQGDRITLFTFTKVPGGPFVSVSCGGTHTMAIDTNGCLWGCGSNSDGELGLDDVENAFSFTKIPLGTPVASVSCGIFHTMVLDTDGYLWFCSRDEYGCDELDGSNLNKIPFDKVTKLMNDTTKKKGCNTKGAHYRLEENTFTKKDQTKKQ